MTAKPVAPFLKQWPQYALISEGLIELVRWFVCPATRFAGGPLQSACLAVARAA